MKRSWIAVLGLAAAILIAGAVQASAAEWQPGVSYTAGTVVSYQGSNYVCLQAHTSLVGWEPPNVPALWRLTSGTPTPTSTAGATPTATSRPTGTASATATPTATPTATTAPTTTPRATASQPTPTARPTPTAGGGSTVNVSTAAQLSAALNAAQPGQQIVLAAGTYSGQFSLTSGGTASAPLVITGPSTAVLAGYSSGGGYGLHLTGVSYVTIKGITIQSSQKGIVLDGSNNCTIDGVTVTGVGMEGIHLRAFSSNNVVQNSRVSSTGLSSPGYGEGFYVGSANSNWASTSGGNPDACNNNKLLNNTIGPNVAAEGLDIKEGTTGGEVRGNRFDSTGISGANYADSWIDVKGNSWLITGNTGTNPSGSLLVDGIQVHVAVAGWGNSNTFTSNNLTVNAAGYGFNVQSGATGNVISSNNVVQGAAKGVANVPLQ